MNRAKQHQKGYFHQALQNSNPPSRFRKVNPNMNKRNNQWWRPQCIHRDISQVSIINFQKNMLNTGNFHNSQEQSRSFIVNLIQLLKSCGKTTHCKRRDTLNMRLHSIMTTISIPQLWKKKSQHQSSIQNTEIAELNGRTKVNPRYCGLLFAVMILFSSILYLEPYPHQ